VVKSPDASGRISASLDIRDGTNGAATVRLQLLDRLQGNPDNRAMTFLEWVSSSIGTATLLAMLGFLARHWTIERLSKSIKYKYEKEIETHKANLKRDYDVQIEQLRAQLQIAATERNVRFSKIFDRIAETIAETYEKLADLKDAIDVMQCSNPQSGQNQAHQEALANVRTKLAEFRDFFVRNKIYIPNPTSELIWKYYSFLHSQHVTFIHAKSFPQGEAPKDMWEHLIKLNEETPKLLNMLQNEFQTLLGITVGEKDKGNAV
jgi:hypothetical protein